MCAFVPVLITAECILLHMCMYTKQFFSAGLMMQPSMFQQPHHLTNQTSVLKLSVPYPIQYEIRYSRFEAKQLGSCFLITLPEHINRNDSSSDTILI